MIRAVIFDLDGTAGYTMPSLQKGMNEMLAGFGYPTHTAEELLQWVSLSPREWVSGALPEGLSPEQFERCFAEYNRCYEKYCLETEYYPGFGDLISRLKGEGIAAAMLSNKLHRQVVALARKLSGVPADEGDPGTFGPVGDYACAWGASERYPHKPDPTSALAMAEMLGVPPGECAFVGDSEVDVYTARNAHMVQISVTWGYRSRVFHEALGVENLADTPEELYTLLHRL